jgi:hypothetical protein
VDIRKKNFSPHFTNIIIIVVVHKFSMNFGADQNGGGKRKVKFDVENIGYKIPCRKYWV